VRGYPFQVLERIGRRHGAATVGAGKAIHFLPYFPVQQVSVMIELFGRRIFYFGEKPTQPGAVLQNLVGKPSSVIRHSDTKT
jgi:hypothetical protein